MKLSGSLAFVSCAVVAILAGRPVSAGAQMPVPTPGPEHEVLKMDAGVWDATVELTVPGNPPMSSKGVETSTLGCGGRCLITDFKGELMPGLAFTGHGVATWDGVKKKYATSWTDSMSGGLSIGESTWDAAAKRMSGWMEGPDMNNQVTKTRSVVEYQGDSRVMTAYAAGPDGKEIPVLKITYVRRK